MFPYFTRRMMESNFPSRRYSQRELATLAVARWLAPKWVWAWADERPGLTYEEMCRLLDEVDRCG